MWYQDDDLKTEEVQADEPKKKTSDDSDDSDDGDDKDKEKGLSNKKKKVSFCIKHSPVWCPLSLLYTVVFLMQKKLTVCSCCLHV